MKKIMRVLVLGFLFLSFGSPVFANEGTVTLRPEMGYKGECFVASVFIDSYYKVLATCRDLPTALGPENNRLFLWRQTEEGKMMRVGELSRGKLSATVNDRFNHLIVTSESSSSSRNPEGPILAQGDLTPINFSVATTNIVVQTTPTPSKTVSATTQDSVVTTDAETTVAESGSKIGAIFSGVAKAVGLGFVLLLVVVGVLGFFARRKGL
jgi:hypothetical protein